MRAILPVIALCAFTVAAFAASEQELMATRYGNTLIIHDSLGTNRVWYNPDHTFHAASWLGDVYGHWQIQNGQMCLYAEQYPALYRLKYSIPECDVIEPHKVGDKWQHSGRDYELVGGIVH
jgi:hypothetical protein